MPTKKIAVTVQVTNEVEVALRVFHEAQLVFKFCIFFAAILAQ